MTTPPAARPPESTQLGHCDIGGPRHDHLHGMTADCRGFRLAPAARPSAPPSDPREFCNAIINDGRHVCRLPKGHLADHHPHLNVDSLRAPAPRSGDGDPRAELLDRLMTPETIAQLRAACDDAAERWAPVAECIAEAKAALAKVAPPHNPEMDTDGLYYPLLFLVKRIEEFDNAD